jgi:Heterokaryon incompatibility protein (HET)
MQGSLPLKGVPLVVEDAMRVVRELGKQYLWVDRYCIDQQDHDGKALQIQNMDLIYEGAYATIIASASPDATAGLPGVSCSPRKVQPSAVVGDQVLISSLPPLWFSLRESAWVKRGWTYQEAILSRRCLFFTETQVYFVCRAMSCSESIVRAASKDSRNGRRVIKTLRADLFELPVLRKEKDCSMLRELVDNITEFTRRQLTYQDDALNAFRGLLARAQFPSYFGLPIAATDSPAEMTEARDWNIGFARGLYWTPHHFAKFRRTGLSRRPGFPTWSWTGWEGAVEYCSSKGPNTVGKDGRFMEVDGTHFDTKIWVEDTQRKLIPVEKLPRLKGGTHLIQELSNYIVIEACVLQLRFQSHGERICLCRCHPDAAHQDILPDFLISGTLCTDELPRSNAALRQRLVTQAWDCVLLFDGKDFKRLLRPLHNLLIIESFDDTARRVGTITIRESHGAFKLLPQKKQRIRLQ